MQQKWAAFLCNCRSSVPFNAATLDLPENLRFCSVSTGAKADVTGFVEKCRTEQPDRILVSCCGSQEEFREALGEAPGKPGRTHFVNLQEQCFWAHPDSDAAHAKASRLIRAAVDAAEVEQTPALHPLKVGRSVLIATDTAAGIQLAEKLAVIAQPVLVVDAKMSALPNTFSGEAARGSVTEIKGRLGAFQVTVEDADSGTPIRRELKADQVVLVSDHEAPPFKLRTGLHILIHPNDDEADRLRDRIRDLTGDFLKPQQVTYNTDICAGGAANNESCGVCVTACPYDAIGRDPENHLRVLVDQPACEGCGACVSACPTTALRFSEPSARALYKRMEALLSPSTANGNGHSATILFHCGEQGHRLLEEAGRRPLPYPSTLLPVEVPCLRYVSEANILGAFRLGAASVALLGCETCQHGKRELLYHQLDFTALTLDAFGLGNERVGFFTTEAGKEQQTVGDLTRFAERQRASPIHWDGRPLSHWGNREVVADAIERFIEQTSREPGLKPLDAAHPYAVAEVAAGGCTMCRSCVNVCPTHAFRVDEGNLSLQFKQISCVACGLCEKVCPEHVITLKREVSFDRAALDYKTVVQDSMIPCAKCGKPYINRKALEMVEARVLAFPMLLDTFSGSRRDLLRMCPDCRTVIAMLEVEKGWKP